MLLPFADLADHPRLQRRNGDQDSGRSGQGGHVQLVGHVPDRSAMPSGPPEGSQGTDLPEVGTSIFFQLQYFVFCIHVRVHCMSPSNNQRGKNHGLFQSLEFSFDVLKFAGF